MTQQIQTLAATTTIGAIGTLGEKLSEFLSTVQQGIDTLGPIGGFILAIVVFLIGRVVARMIRGLIVKGLDKTSLDDKCGKLLGYSSGAGQGIANFIYGLMLLFLAILALGVAKLDKVSTPLQAMLEEFLGFIPNLVGAGVLLYLVLIVAKVVKNLAGNILQAGKLDERLGASKGETPITSAIVMALYCFIVLLFIPAVLDVLNLASVSKPVGGVVQRILDAVPNIILAAILIGLGILIGQIARRLVTNLLDAAGANQWPAKIGLDIPTEGDRSLSNITGFLVMISVAILMIGAAIDQLNIELLAGASQVIVEGFFNILIAILIFGAGILASKFAYRNLADKNVILAKVAKVAILVVTGVIALQRTDLAPELTGLPYTATIYALAFAGGVGGAIAIGLGGKDFVSRKLEDKK
ncbi:MAG: mechanosensitive ion channel [Verrucomicrobiae bacterium]|nr:mechanosensitive ion channel [Verrucomicrobiae bacterium]NNJ41952.1 mechanosensitive ion channel [Akkermansiaceae bacterium]